MVANRSQLESARSGRRLESFIRGDWRGVLPSILRILLAPAAILYGAVSTLRLSLWRRGVRKRVRLSVPVISVGNITVGGTGKSPFVRWLCEWLLERGHRPLVLARGYGAHAPGDPLDEEGRALATALPGVTVAQGRDRAATAREALGADPAPTVIVLDDGFQHARLDRDVDLVLVDAARPFGAGLPLPAGPLRELPTGLREADVVIATRVDRLAHETWPEVRDRLASYSRCERILAARHVADRLILGDHGPEWLAGRQVWLLCAIAEPESFERVVRELGAQVLGQSAFRDHHDFSLEDLRGVTQRAQEAGAELLLCTGKDAPKLRPHAETLEIGIEALEVRLEMDEADALALGALLVEGMETDRREPAA